jgi:SRSO17 transposase
MQSRRKNMERMAEVVPKSDEQSLQHFISNVDWDARAVMEQVAQEAGELLGAPAETALLFDESGFEKKGKHSVGVGRQWNGRRGKVDNCQVGVFASLCSGRYSTLVNARLYLPEEWTNDKRRCRQADIPEGNRSFKTKPELALEMVKQAREMGLSFGWVGADGLYENNPELLLSLDALGEILVIDVHKNQRIYINDTAPVLPTNTSKHGRKPSQYKSDKKTIKVEDLVKRVPASSWKRVTLRDGDKGTLIVEVIRHGVWIWDGKSAECKHWHLVVRREIDSPNEIKYSLSNVEPGTSVERLAHMQGQRFWIERSFQDAKSHCGLGDYQVRGWQGWHHHMALVMMAMLFMLKERLQNEEAIPLLSCSDIEILLTQFLPRRNTTDEEIISQMEKRHRKRQSAIESQKRKQEIAGVD